MNEKILCNSSGTQYFTSQVKVRFMHCDPAKIVFYPRYYDMLNVTIEEFFEEVAELDHLQMMSSDIGVPMAHLSIDFLNPSYLGDILNFNLYLVKIGTSSIKLSIEVISGSGELRIKGEGVVVFYDLKKQSSIPIPNKVRSRLVSFKG